MSPTKRAVLYCRVSTDEQRKNGNSIPHQEKVLRASCERRGYEVDAVYLEDESAKDFNRPEYQSMASYCLANRKHIDYILVTRWDRWSRNTHLGLGEMKRFEEAGIIVHALEQGEISEEMYEGLYLTTISMVHGEVENKRKSKMVRASFRERSLQGYWCHKPPKGYKSNPLTKIMEPNEEAPLITEAFEQVATANYSIEEVYRSLKAKGLKCSKSQFHQTLRKPLYKGYIHVKETSKEPAQEVLGVHKPIVNEGLWHTVQMVLDGRKRSAPKRKAKNPKMVLRGLLECKQCGSKLTGGLSRGNGGQYAYYQCQSNGCRERFRAEEPNQQIQIQLDALKPQPEVLTLFNLIMERRFSVHEKDRTKRLGQLRQQIMDIKKRLEKLDEHWLDGNLDMLDFQRASSAQKKKQAELTAQYSGLEAVAGDYSKYIKSGASIVANLGQAYRTSSTENKQRILGSILVGNLVFDKPIYRTIPFNTAVSSLAFTFKELAGPKKEKPSSYAELSYLAPQVGLEPTTYGLTVRRSNQLSY